MKSAPPDRLTEANLRKVLIAAEAACLEPPDSLEGAARAMFETVVAGNRSRPWNAAHVDVLANYCRVSILWAAQWDELEREGPMIELKPNARFKTLRALAFERYQLARLLGLSGATRNRELGGGDLQSMRAREIGGQVAATRGDDAERLLA